MGDVTVIETDKDTLSILVDNGLRCRVSRNHDESLEWILAAHINDLTKQLSDCEQDKGNLVEAVKYLRESTSGTAQWHTALRLLWAALPQEDS